ncbi:MAG: T9SS type B sorting domain-containing protein [Eudoraea sp.]|nr:T9SS type B sorting domain-containing protein [Eudoraea sp.]NNK30614.1 T9SS type B sorting domain-containing protein [Flavobacteriaceae bacterium]
MPWFLGNTAGIRDMVKKHLIAVLLLTAATGWSQTCPVPVFPMPGQTVPVESIISWTEVVGITAYKIRVGTSPGGSEITPLVSTGLATNYNPQGLPENSTIYVEIYIFNRTQGDTLCSSYSFNTASFTAPPGCTVLTSPADGEQNVPVQSVIRWRYSPTATSYLISLGTTPGGTDILDNQSVVGELQYDPDPDLLPETDYYVTIIPENRLGPAANCREFSFRTGPLATIPACSSIIYPTDGEFDVPISPLIRWNSVTGAEGYFVSIGTSPTLNDILDNADFSGATETNVINFEPNRQYFITITPYNSAGQALACNQTSFFTLLGCGPYFDIDGNLIDLNPTLDFPNNIGICSSGDTTINALEYGAIGVDGYRWYSIPPFGREVLLAEGPDFDVPEDGEYRLEIYNLISGPSGTFECSNSQNFFVTQSEQAVIERTDVQLGVGVITIEVEVSGSGDYEYALGNPGGPYQDSNRFTGLPIDNYWIYVRDKNGCGIAEVLIEPDLTLDGFPKFFTPNGDGVNDFWQFISPVAGGNSNLETILIFDRYGTLLAQIEPDSRGWDGEYQGTPLPSSDYWFLATTRDNEQLRGHFSLKR